MLCLATVDVEQIMYKDSSIYSIAFTLRNRIGCALKVYSLQAQEKLLLEPQTVIKALKDDHRILRALGLARKNVSAFSAS